ncbi:MAG: SDR family NAD(P)-dependent oxidoreductase [Pseudomonadales bacterium]|nr:SDR family NAD(P)-dependent oxidoreductase [Pseudomonadales bacterium]
MTKQRRTWSSNAVVTGAGSGIGRGFALELAARGCAVVCSDIVLERAEETAALIEASGGRALPIQTDVSKISAVQALANEAEAWFEGPVHLVINNAGVGAGGKPIGDIPMADWKWVMGVNLWGVIHGCHVFAPRLRATGFGGIINVCSTASFAAAPRMGPYNTSKAAALALSETLAAELADTDVAVTALCPTWVKTNITKDGRIEANATAFANKLMTKTGLSPERVAKQTLNALERGQLYVLPQLDAKAIWGAKRLLPSLYTRGAGLLNRFLSLSNQTH